MCICNSSVASFSSLCPLIYGHLVSHDTSSMYPKGSFFHFLSFFFVVSESSFGFGTVWRQTKTHRQEQRSSEGGPTHPDRWRPWAGKEPDVTGNA